MVLLGLASMGFVGLALAKGLCPLRIALAWALLLLAPIVRAVGIWFFALRARPLSLEAPPESAGVPRATTADLVSLPLLLPLGTYAASYVTGLTWYLSAAIAGLVLALGVILPFVYQRSLRPRASDLVAAEALRSRAAEHGCEMTLHGVTRSGHGVLLLQGGDGPELVWYLQYRHPTDPPADVVLQMLVRLRAHELQRGWILAQRPPRRRLFHYAQQFGIVLATPEWFLDELADRDGSAPEPGNCPEASPDVSLRDGGTY